MDANKLKAKIVEKGFTVCNLSELLGINSSVMYRKLNDLNKLTIGEVLTLKAILDLSDNEAINIFLGA